MKTPQVPALPGMTPLGVKPYAQILAEKPILAPVNQKPCDEGLFGDGHKQTELFK
jgi:hypothetical protein